jgi:dodecin
MVALELSASPAGVRRAATYYLTGTRRSNGRPWREKRRWAAVSETNHGLTPGVFAPQARTQRTREKHARTREGRMAESVYKVIELVGTSSDSWEKAAKAAIERASRSLRDMRVAEVVEQDLVIEKGKVEAFRTKLKVSFKYEGKDD